LRPQPPPDLGKTGESLSLLRAVLDHRNPDDLVQQGHCRTSAQQGGGHGTQAFLALAIARVLALTLARVTLTDLPHRLPPLVPRDAPSGGCQSWKRGRQTGAEAQRINASGFERGCPGNARYLRRPTQSSLSVTDLCPVVPVLYRLPALRSTVIDLSRPSPSMVS